MKLDDKCKFQRETSVIFFDKYRYFILFLGWLCLASISSNMIALNFTLICMSPPVTNSTETTVIVDNYNTFDYTTWHKNMLMWTVAAGALFGTVIFSWAYSQYGAKFVLLAAGLVSAFVTTLIPFAARNSFLLFLVIRFIQGICYSADFAAMGLLCSIWASLKQNAFFISVLTCYSPLSSSITNSLSAFICESRFGWSLVYYAHAVVCVLLFGLWAFFYSDRPFESLFVSDVELEKINRNKSDAQINIRKFVPYKEIFQSPVVWVVWLNAFTDLFSGMFLLMYLPSYLKYVINYSVENTGIMTSFPTLSHIILKFIFGYTSDKFRCMPERYKLIIFNSIAVVCPGIVYALVGFVPSDNKILTVILFTLIQMFFSTSGGGFYKCGTLHSRQYAYLVIASIQFVKCLTLFLGPTLMSIFVTDETDKTQWRSIFLLLAVMLFIANTFFIFYATEQPAAFTLITSKKEQMDAETSKMLLEKSASQHSKDVIADAS